jgi:hypothetical protein
MSSTSATVADWTVRPAERDWTFKADATNRLSTAQEAFIAPTQDIRMSACAVRRPRTYGAMIVVV